MVIRTTKDLAHLIRDQRLRRALTQADLAHLVGVSRKWVVDLEAGKRTPDISLVLLTIRTLGLELSVRDRGSRRGGTDFDVDQIVARSQRTRG